MSDSDSDSDEEFVPDPEEFVPPIKELPNPKETENKKPKHIILGDLDLVVEIENAYSKWEKYQNPIPLKETLEKYPYTPTQMEKYIRFQNSDSYFLTLQKHTQTINTTKMQKERNEFIFSNPEYISLKNQLNDPTLTNEKKIELTTAINNKATYLQSEFLLKKQKEKILNSPEFHEQHLHEHQKTIQTFRKRIKTLLQEEQQKETSKLEIHKPYEHFFTKKKRQRRRKSPPEKTTTKKKKINKNKKRKRKELEEEEEVENLEPIQKKRKLNLKVSNLDSILTDLKGETKVSALQQSRNIWEKVKVDEEFKEEVEYQAKDGFLEKQDFLQRIEKKGELMSKKMKIKERQMREMKQRADQRRRNR